MLNTYIYLALIVLKWEEIQEKIKRKMRVMNLHLSKINLLNHPLCTNPSQQEQLQLVNQRKMERKIRRRKIRKRLLRKK